MTLDFIQKNLDLTMKCFLFFYHDKGEILKLRWSLLPELQENLRNMINKFE